MADEKMCTIRLDESHHYFDNPHSYSVKIDGKYVYFPKSLSKVTVHDSKFIDFDCPVWFAKKKGLMEYSVAEY